MDARKNCRPRAMRRTRSGRLDSQTEGCVATGIATGLNAPMFDSGMINAFLELYSREFARRDHVLL